MRYAVLFLGLLGCTEYGFGKGPDGGDFGDDGSGVGAYGDDSTPGGTESYDPANDESTDGTTTDQSTDDDGTFDGTHRDTNEWDYNGDGEVDWDEDTFVDWGDDGDYVPEDGEKCDEITDIDALNVDGDNKVVLCHATGSSTNPYVIINIDVSGCREHDQHQDGRDELPTYGCRS